LERLKGIPASPGVAVGPVFLFLRDEVRVERQESGDPGREARRLREALEQAAQEIREVQAATAAKIGESEAAVFGAHLLFLVDPTLVDASFDKIRDERASAEWALQSTGDEIAAMLSQVEDPYLRERAADVRDVVGRILNILTGRKPPTLEHLKEPSVIVAHDLSPSETATMDPKLVMGFAIDEGGPTSHTVILARTLGIPAVVGTGSGAKTATHGEQAILEGTKGELILRPDAAELLKAKVRMHEIREQKLRQEELISLPAQTADGERLELAANIGTPHEAAEALRWGADAIGLFRTEFLYMDRAALPNEEEQFEAYQQVLKTMGPGRPVVIRTLDIGGDKHLDAIKMPREANPFLGLRAIRLTLHHRDLFKVQLRALLRASAYGRLRIMYPMIQSLQEIQEANELLEEARREVIAAGQPVGKPEIGIMIEIPAAALIADLLAPHVDFFSIGTNDLIQYTVAADRMNPRVAHLYQPFHPAVLRLIGRVCTAAHQAGKWVGICGEMGGDPAAAPVLLGLGLDEFSMTPVSLPAVKEVLRATHRAEAKTLAATLIKLTDPREIRQKAEEFYRSRFAH
jgi:phosphoenolpyruvate-protein phosphotransferase (PTS system enzyme I)